jgi:preprotein translocase subunit YajC
MDRDTIIFYAVLGTVVVIVSIVRFIGWRKEKKEMKEQEQMKIKNNIKA